MNAAPSGTPAEGASRAAPAGKIAIDRCWAAGFRLLFTRLHRLIPQIWLPFLAIFWFENGGLVGRAVGSQNLTATLEYSGLEILLYALIGASAYAIAFGRFDRWTFARFEIGAAELRYMLAKLVFWAAFFGLFLGATLIGQKVLGIVAASNQIISGASGAADDATWLRDLTVLGFLAFYGPIAIAAWMFAWFGTRFSLVFPHATAARRFALFEAMALTKGNAWRLIGLFVLLAVALGIVFGIIWWQLGLPLNGGTSGAATGPPTNTVPYTFGKTTLAAPVKHVASWLEPLVMASMGTIWQIVFAGALAHAYKSVAPDEA